MLGNFREHGILAYFEQYFAVVVLAIGYCYCS